jgi:hypothetical protein
MSEHIRLVLAFDMAGQTGPNVDEKLVMKVSAYFRIMLVMNVDVGTIRQVFCSGPQITSITHDGNHGRSRFVGIENQVDYLMSLRLWPFVAYQLANALRAIRNICNSQMGVRLLPNSSLGTPE